MELSELKTWLEKQKAPIEKALRELVNINTYTANHQGVDDGMDALSILAQKYKLPVEVVSGRHRLVKAGNGKGKVKVLLISHMDTVFPPESNFKTYQDLGNGFVTGPGVGDIKGGLLIGLWSMLALREMCQDFDVQMIVSADEEIGSPTIRDWYLEGQIGADYAIGLEPGFCDDDKLTVEGPWGVVYQRRGYGSMKYVIKGHRTHSGTPQLGINALEAAAQRVIKMHALTDYARGVTVTVGVLNGGTAANTVPDEVKGTVSWRFERMADGQAIESQLRDIISAKYVYNEILEKYDSADYELDAFVPPMENNVGNQKLIDLVLSESQRLGQNTKAIARGGGSDANFVSTSGTPSICGMGTPVQGIHTEKETIYLPGLYDRIELLSSVLYRMVNGALS